jgi:hypothetical protein
VEPTGYKHAAAGGAVPSAAGPATPSPLLLLTHFSVLNSPVISFCFGAALLAVLALGFGIVPEAAGQPSIQTILTNGPVSNRLNVVVLSEGYTTSQLAQFLLDATNTVNVLLSHPPYQEYRNYLNVFAIKVASNQSGSDHPSYGLYRDTYFNSTYDSVEDYLITVPEGSTGQGRVDALLQTLMPQCQLAILLVNDPTDGGSDGFYKTAIVSTGGLAYEATIGQPGILSHETGHVVANLGDEYTTPNPGSTNTEEPNTTQQTNRLLIKWKAWISTDTPIPTPPTSDYSSVVGLFRGAHYHTNYWYRPQLNCAMGSLGVPFCAVCSEALVLAIYRKTRPVDSISPVSANLTVSTTQALTFSLTLLQPATHSLKVQWYTNSMAVTGATDPNLTLSPTSLSNGNHTVSAVVRDNTPLVRSDPTNLLTQTVTWALNVNLAQLRLDSPLWLTGGKFAFRIIGNAPQSVIVQGSTNLLNWGSLATNSLVAGQWWYTNSSAGSSPRSFYRAITR